MATSLAGPLIELDVGNDEILRVKDFVHSGISQDWRWKAGCVPELPEPA